MSKRPRTQNHPMAPDPAAANIRDPEQKNDELDRQHRSKPVIPRSKKENSGPVADGS